MIAENGSSIQEIINITHPDDKEKFIHDFSMLSHKQVSSLSNIYRFLDNSTGDYRYYEGRMTILPRDKQSPDSVLGTQKDITDTIATQKELEEYRAKTQLIIDSSGITLWEYYLSDSSCHMINSDILAIMKEKLSRHEYIQYVHPHDRHLANDFFDKMDHQTGGLLSQEFRVRPDRSLKYRWIRVNAIAYLKDPAGHTLKYICIKRDNTKWHTLTDESSLLS